MPTPPPDPDLLDEARRAIREGASISEAARRSGLAPGTVKKHCGGDLAVGAGVKEKRPQTSYAPARLPDPDPIAGGPSLPDPVPLSYEPFDPMHPGRWLVLGDVHLPYHDKRTVELAVEEARRVGASGVLLNGDLLDSHEVSDHHKDRDARSYAEEIETGRQFLAWLRSRLPRARIVFKEGNHDSRVERYVFERAPAIAGLDGVSLPGFLRLADHGVEWVADKRAVMLGRLPVLHGHEYPGGGGVNPARWLFLRTVSTAMCGHFHRTSEHHQRGISQKVYGVWSVGCACFLHPRYRPLNEWNHGFAVVDVAADGSFHVDNRRVLDGRLV